MTVIPELTDQEVLARTAYGENRGGGIEGMQSVLNVVMNRANIGGWWGNNPREVCLKPYQFSSWNSNDANYKILSNEIDPNDIYTEALNLAAQALDGNLEDITLGSTYYIAEDLSPWPHWAEGHSPCAHIANQIFFNDIG